MKRNCCVDLRGCLVWRAFGFSLLCIGIVVSSAAESTNWTTAQDHKQMMQQLGIARLRPGPSGRTGATNSANYDPAKANPFPDVPPRYVRALWYQYRFSSPEVRKKTGLWWVRESVGSYFPTVSLQSPALRAMLQQMGWE